MKAKLKAKCHTIPFQRLATGDLFTVSGRPVYMVTELMAVLDHPTLVRNVVNIETGHTAFFDDHTHVEIINGTFIEE